MGTTVGMLLALAVGGILSALVAWLIGLPVLRLRSDYLAIATLGFAEILRAFFQWNALGPITNASNLLRGYPDFQHVTSYFLLAGVLIAVIVLLINSTYGRAFKAIRDDEVAAEAMGINLASTSGWPLSSAPSSPAWAAACWPCTTAPSPPPPSRAP